MRRLAAVAVLGLAVTALGIGFPLAPAPARTPAEPRGPAADWPRYGRDDQLTNDVPAALADGLDHTSASRLAEAWRVPLDGPVVASPLYWAQRDRLYVATEAGSLYALDGGTGKMLWRRKVDAAPVKACGFRFGVSSTGVLDVARHRIYAIGATGLLTALDLVTGAVVKDWPVRITTNDAEYVWGGLTLFDGLVYVPTASFCDLPDSIGHAPDGRLVAVDTAQASAVLTWEVVPGEGNLGGIWGYGGTSIDPLTTNLWTATGNALETETEAEGLAEAVVELDRRLQVLAWNRPPGIPVLEGADTDFGSTPLLLQPSGCPPLAAAHSKNGRLYVWRRDRLVEGPIWTAHIGPNDLDSPFIGQPSYSAALRTLFVANGRIYDELEEVVHLDAAAAFTIGPGCELPAAPTWVAAGVGSGPKPPPLVVGDVVFVVGGNSSGLTALDARTGAELWTRWLGAPLYSPPIFAEGRVVVATMGGQVYAFDLRH